ncbi:HAD-IA family hydrolase [Microvirga tunisiensis]|uniref:HAD-IA family hydrolase n=2 Tax=Pannonibacter tanglangensis TaxID=2750084 RepID=A0A7X5F3T4_9HYPH|nr:MULTISPECIES: HAD family phosphatase [unclassified Pannonibacter]NBN64671.1 HAD-IA family hydrolase [Pannonibacter sp. XCT-34]NBN79206.1 HAD-IA family hydrolase [Pannonibacter sp. XCT-53]
MPSPVTTVVFDIGNVLIEWDPEHLYRRLIPDAAARRHFLTEVCSPDWNLEQDRGRSWSEAVAERVALYPDHADLIRAYDSGWHEMVPGEVPGSVRLLSELGDRGVPLYAITNFSAEKFVEARARFPFLGTAFRDTVVSAEERLLKPDPRIYEVLLARNGLDAASCVFIDDSLKNVEGARNVGMAAIHFTGAEALRVELRRMGFGV